MRSMLIRLIVGLASLILIFGSFLAVILIPRLPTITNRIPVLTPTASAIPRIPFKATSVNTPFAIAGTIAGDYRLISNAIEVHVDELTIIHRDNAPYKGPHEIAGINASLGTALPDGAWNTFLPSSTIPIHKTTSPGDTVILKNLTFIITSPDSLDLSKHWLVFTMEDRIPGSDDVKQNTGYAYIHSERTIFAKSNQ